MKKLLRAAALAGILVLCYALPYRVFIGPFSGLFPGEGVDAVSSASVILDAPSGSYVVLLNGDRHRKYGTAEDWAAFFRGESLVIMDDVRCAVGAGDAAGRQMAESYRSRLPENQMTISDEDPLMMLSKAQYGGFDVIVMSAEFARAYSAETAYGVPGVRVLEIRDGA